MGDHLASREDIARLFGRAAFGATAADLDQWAGKPYEEVVGFLVDVPTPLERPPLFDEARRVAVRNAYSTGGSGLAVFGPEEAQTWWLDRMRTTPYPLEERMTLFLHDHFATGIAELPDTGMLMDQNETLRRHSLGNFRDLCAAITTDPAMIYWLNSYENIKDSLNENYAREFLELFTLGTIPQVYFEQDIREAARVLTGWSVDIVAQRGQFYPEYHDEGAKVVLGTQIANNGEKEHLDLLDLALRQDVAPLFVAYKLVYNFTYVPETPHLIAHPDPLVDKVAAALRSSSWDLRAAVRTMLLADEFRYSDLGRGRQAVRQPVELVVHACKILGISIGDYLVLEALRRMGQKPFQPPNVGGWPMGKSWLSSATMLARYDWAVWAHDLWQRGPEGVRVALPSTNNLDAWIAFMGMAGSSDNTRNSIYRYLETRRDASVQEREAGLLILLAACPEWGVM